MLYHFHLHLLSLPKTSQLDTYLRSLFHHIQRRITGFVKNFQLERDPSQEWALTHSQLQKHGQATTFLTLFKLLLDPQVTHLNLTYKNSSQRGFDLQSAVWVLLEVVG